MQERQQFNGERPLSGGEKTGLVVSALGAIALFYLFSAVAIGLLLLLLAIMGAAFDTLLDAMQPGKRPARAATLFWREARKDQQPVRPVRPGVQFAL